MYFAGSAPDDAPFGRDASNDEHRLVVRVRAGAHDDARDAFGEIFSRYGPRLLAFARMQLGTLVPAEDLIQELFLSIWANRESWVVRGSLTTYLFQATRNRIINARRDAAVRARIGELADVDTVAPARQAGPDELLSERDLQAIVDRVVRDLPPRAREAYLLVRVNRLSHADAARIMGVTTDAVVGHLRRALQGLRDGIAGEGARKK